MMAETFGLGWAVEADLSGGWTGRFMGVGVAFSDLARCISEGLRVFTTFVAAFACVWLASLRKEVCDAFGQASCETMPTAAISCRSLDRGVCWAAS